MAHIITLQYCWFGCSALPSFNREEVDGDIESVRTWIEKKKDEL